MNIAFSQRCYKLREVLHFKHTMSSSLWAPGNFRDFFQLSRTNFCSLDMILWCIIRKLEMFYAFGTALWVHTLCWSMQRANPSLGFTVGGTKLHAAETICQQTPWSCSQFGPSQSADLRQHLAPSESCQWDCRTLPWIDYLVYMLMVMQWISQPRLHVLSINQTHQCSQKKIEWKYFTQHS